MVEEMKPSGIEWIGKIPEKWQIGRICHCYSLTLGKMVESSTDDPSKTLQPYLCAANVKWGGVDLSVRKEMYLNKAEQVDLELRDGDVLITEGGSIGTTCVYHGELGRCYFQNSIIRARGNSLFDNDFLAYWLELVCNSGYLDVICNRATISHYTKEKVARTPFLLVPHREVVSIVEELDKKCAELERAGKTIAAQIQHLESYRSSIIHELVTKGLNPNAPMKPSGVEWMGDIPSEWSITKLKHIARTCNGLDYDSEDVCSPDDAGAALVVRSSNISNGEMVHADDVFVNTKIPDSVRLRKDDLVIVRANGSPALVGKSALFSLDGSCVAGGFMLICRSEDNRFLRWLLQSNLLPYYRGAFDTTTINRLSASMLGNMLIPWPSKGEREQIAKNLSKITESIDAVIDTKRRQLDVLKKRRQSLIYEYVTGKRRVSTKG